MKENIELQKVEHFLESEKHVEVKSNDFEKIMFLYKIAIKEIESKLEILKEESKIFYDYDLIDHINTRIKSPESIKKKMREKSLKYTYREMIECINDIAGIRVICPFKKDVYSVRNLVTNLPGIKILKEKDYISNPKKSGYSSYHMIIEVPVVLSQGLVFVKVEIQIRTLAMDFWASIEHRLKYKTHNNLTKYKSKELIQCAKMINKLDNKMMSINK